MPVVNELAPHGLVDWKPSVGGHLSCSGDKSAKPNESSEDTSKNDLSESRHKNLSKVSDAWRRTLAHRDGYDPISSKHPRYTTRKLKQEVQAVLNAERSSVNDSGKVYGLVQDILELLFEAELHRSTMCTACERLKEQFERDANFIRDLHAKQNVPIAITNTLLDTPFPLTKTNNADISSSISSVNLEGNGTKVLEPWIGANSLPPSSSPNVIVPPPLPPQSQPFSCVPLIDVTRPPPPIAEAKQVANLTPVAPPPPPPAAPPPSIGIPATNLPPMAVDCSFAIPPPARAPSNEMLTPPSCPLSVWAPTTVHPTVPVQETVSSVLNATLRPNTSNQYSGPFGPPIGSFHNGSSQAVDTFDGLQDRYPPSDVAPFQCFSDRRWNYRRPYNKEHVGGDRQRCFKRRRYSSQSHC
ncbi:unnamed protein product [Cylicocyclus nassatus]|uniref:Uncharacterized protein n=1 Tax=Cylicocyclus nassatus TaxID=53992 RepID=A0AA36GFV1_CYLNA|nr:unnamed protein product [Cylicocyclus nassatus]